MQDRQRGISGEGRPEFLSPQLFDMSEKRCSRIGINDRAVIALPLLLLQLALALAAGPAGAAARAAQAPAETEQTTEPTAAAESEITAASGRQDMRASPHTPWPLVQPWAIEMP